MNTCTDGNRLFGSFIDACLTDTQAGGDKFGLCATKGTALFVHWVTVTKPLDFELISQWIKKFVRRTQFHYSVETAPTPPSDRAWELGLLSDTAWMLTISV